jgi:hypothetical protein
MQTLENFRVIPAHFTTMGIHSQKNMTSTKNSAIFESVPHEIIALIINNQT